MQIMPYLDKYYDDVLAIVKNFHKEAIQLYDKEYDGRAAQKTIEALRTNASTESFLLIIDNKCQGILAGIQAPSFLNGKHIFQELIWYVNPAYRKYGVAMLRYAEEYLRSVGYDTMIMAVIEGSKTEKIKRFYERMGFELFESQYIRNLQ